MKKKVKKNWIRFRHRVVVCLLRHPVHLFCKWKYGVKIERFREQNGRQYLVVLNHQTTFDQFFLGIAFKNPVYYLATEDIFSNGWVSSLIRYLVAPIPIKKQTTDVRAVMNCIKVSKEGGTIALAPEGNRTYSGKTEYMNPAIASLIKKLGLPLAFFRIEGGYGVQPRWSDCIRKGKMKAYVSKVLEPEDYKSLSDDELLKIISQELFVNDCYDGVGEFHSKKRAEYIERAIYVCPECGLSVFESQKDIIRCKKCGLEAKYLPSLKFESSKGKFPFTYMNDWYDYQKDFISNCNTLEYSEKPAFRDNANLFEVIVYKNKKPLVKNCKISLYGNRVVFDEGGENELVLSFDDVSVVSVLGRNKLNIYHNSKIYQLKGEKSFNALKYVHFYYRYKNIKAGIEGEQFLGL